jgi:guanine nucleotide-binding protein subunit beta-2-like 1 protein
MSVEVSETLQYRGYLKGHKGSVTSLKVGMEKTEAGVEREFLISGSRDTSIIAWEITPKDFTDDDQEWGKARRIYNSHSHIVQDLSLSQDSRYCLSASWDKTLRLWDLESGKSTVTFVDHEKDVLSCSFSADNRQIASGSMDKTIKIWNTVGQCKYTVQDEAHTDWVSKVRFSPDTKNPVLATASWDGTIKVWDSNTMMLKNTFNGHTNAVLSLDFAQRSHYLASGGKDGNIMLWNVNEGSFMKHKEHNAPINQVLFSPTKYWIVAATDNGILVWNLPKDKIIVRLTVQNDEEDDIKLEVEEEAEEIEEKKKKLKLKNDIACTSIAWNRDGNLLFAGFADNLIRVYEVAKV